VICAGSEFFQNLRRGHYELGVDVDLVLQRQFLVMVDGDHGVGSGRFGLGAGGVAARSTS
jgi:hypothetical protein